MAGSGATDLTFAPNGDLVFSASARSRIPCDSGRLELLARPREICL